MSILQHYPYKFCAFGSRAKNTARELSDLDICVMESIPAGELIKLETEFAESDLPYKVDLTVWDDCNTSFQQIIKNDMVALE